MGLAVPSVEWNSARIAAPDSIPVNELQTVEEQSYSVIGTTAAEQAGQTRRDAAAPCGGNPAAGLRLQTSWLPPVRPGQEWQRWLQGYC